MDQRTLLILLSEKQEPSWYSFLASQDEALLAQLICELESNPTAVKYQCEKIIRALSETLPQKLYPYFDRLAVLLKHENSFLRWGMLLTLPNLLAEETRSAWQNVYPQYLAFYESNEVTAFGNATQSAHKLVQFASESEQDIIPRILSCENRIFLHKGDPSPECLEVARGHALDCFEQLYEASAFKPEMRAFALRCKSSERGTVRTKAKRFLENHSE